MDSEQLKCFKTQEVHVYILLSSGAKLVTAHGLCVTDAKCVEIKKLLPIKTILLFSAGAINFYMIRLSKHYRKIPQCRKNI